MKKLLLIVAAFIMLGIAPIQAQTAPAKQKTTTAKTKKDGTPDMRYKENKAAKPAKGPMKKDGTPDKRYKANK